MNETVKLMRLQMTSQGVEVGLKFQDAILAYEENKFCQPQDREMSGIQFKKTIRDHSLVTQQFSHKNVPEELFLSQS